MSIEVKVPNLPESVADATIATWHVKVGDSVRREQNLVDLETDKVVLEVPAPSDGVLTEIFFQKGDIVNAQQLLARMDVSAQASPTTVAEVADAVGAEEQHSPSVRRAIAEHDLANIPVTGSGKDGRLTKEDVVAYIASGRAPTETAAPKKEVSPSVPQTQTMGLREERRVPMSRLRARVAERLLEAQHNTAMLTTFNEVNLHTVMQLRAQYKDIFEKKHGVKLGFLPFFTKAVVAALKRFPSVNASIDGHDIIYHGYYDIGVAVSTDRGLVVPVIRDVDTLSLADIEKSVQTAATRARDGKLSLEEMQGGTFTITNGGVFGSLMSTPILNLPQTGILGMHKIQDRPIAENGQVVIRPMMYIALSYDHRLIDGRESVQFLVAVKECLEDPTRMLLEI
ncbi:MAG: 2-oxoglutarate dehydrogenase complex dihydrolipoyllysine-residue succinyltransferase [Legionellaceae bacterium]|nr:2-oxoglutarate dehydrogenase complex dihydrolipoyllysine-residue succinyltransferase [Legionellaceae bacterium]